MKILIQSTYFYAPHFETELELALDFLKDGHEVCFLCGTRNLRTTFANPLKKSTIDRAGISRIKRGIAILKRQSGVNADKIHVISYPFFDVSGFEIPNFDSLENLKQFKYKGIDVGLAAASSLISFVRDHKPDTYQHYAMIRKAIRTAIFVYESCQLVFEKVKPDKVLIFNGRFVENRPLMRLCEQRDVPFMTHERSGQLDRYLLRQNSIPHSIDSAKEEMLRLWEDASEDRVRKAEKFYIDRRNKVEQGWYSFTKNQIQGKLPADFESDMKNIVIFNSSMDEYEGVAGFNSPLYANDNEGIKRIAESLFEHPDYRIFLRVHPNLRNLVNSQVKELFELEARYSNLRLIRAEETVDSYGLMEAADKVLVFTSTMGVEAAYWGKAVILAGRSFAEDLGCFYRPGTHEELMDLLLTPRLEGIRSDGPLKYGYWQLTMGHPFKYYKPLAVSEGQFLGTSIKPSWLWSRLRELENSLFMIKKNFK